MKTPQELMNSLPLDDESKSALLENWNAAIEDASSAIKVETRKEILKKYQDDMTLVTEATENMINGRIEDQMSEMRESIEKLLSEKSELTRKYESEIVEFKKETEKRYEDAIAIMEKRMEVQLAILAEDVKASREATVDSIRDHKERYETMTESLRDRSAKVMEYIIEHRLSNHIGELKSDIEEAKKAKFATELFESFASIYRDQFFRVDDEFKALTEKAEKAEARAEAVVSKAKVALKEASLKEARAARMLNESQKKLEISNKINDLVAPLPTNQKAPVRAILESSDPESLERTFKSLVRRATNEPGDRKSRIRAKNPPARIAGAPRSQPLTEGTDHESADPLLEELRLLSGINGQ